jgi:acyl-CoA synthetase (AMP-forming)/AMP-acid ligase II
MIAGPALHVETTLLGALERNARLHPERDAIRVLAGGEEVTASITHGELADATAEIAAGLVARGYGGKPLVVALPPGIELIVAILGCMRAGAYAVTIPFPAGSQQERIAAIVADARPAAVLTSADDPAQPSGALAALPAQSLRSLREGAASLPEPAPESPALIQYSSGSTRTPRGVAITHGNLAANLRMMELAFSLEPGVVTVTWLPPWHDMGLIGTILLPLFAGGTVVVMPPMVFFKKPIRWLRAIEAHGCAFTGAPNFGYDVCARRVTAESALELDLSGWKVAFCGAEPIRMKTLDDFAERLAPAGFSRTAWHACYGLAEATLLVSDGPPREVAVESERVAFSRVTCGRPAPGCAILLRPPAGEICTSGPHATPGWWDGERERVVPWDDQFFVDGVRFLPTGDAGIFSDGEIVILDRLKDVIAIHGRNVHALDVEQALIASADGAVVAAAAFAVPSERGERLVALCEISRRDAVRVDPPTLLDVLANAVSSAIGVAPEIVLLHHGKLPRTSSGKIQRYASRAGYMAGVLP